MLVSARFLMIEKGFLTRFVRLCHGRKSNSYEFDTREFENSRFLNQENYWFSGSRKSRDFRGFQRIWKRKFKMEEKEDKYQEIIKKYNIDIAKLKKEQEKLAKQIDIKDSMDFSKAVKIGGISNIFFQNKIVSVAVVLDDKLEIIEQKYFSDKVKFPYIPGFRAYRELPAMVSCFNLLDEKPEVVFISGHGISHERLGLASHFSIAVGVPSIGVADELITGKLDGENIIINEKVVGKLIQLKQGSRPIYVSPGNGISVKSAVELAKKFIRLPHKLPEPLHFAHRYAREVMKEVTVSS